MPRVLAVHADRDTRNLIADTVVDECADAIVDTASNEEEARERLRRQASVRDPYDLVIASVAIPANRRDARIDSEGRGIVLFRSLPQLGHSGKPAILVAPVIDVDVQMKIQGIEHLFLAKDGAELDEQIAEFAKRLLSKGGKPNASMVARVTLTLDLTNHRWDYTIKGIGFIYNDGPRPLIINERAIEQLIERSRRLPRNDPYWVDEMRDLGAELADQIFKDNLVFYKRVTEAADRAGGSDHKVICFNVEEKVHPAMLEALAPRGEEFWMLEVPIYRRLTVVGQAPFERKPIFSDSNRTPFRALIIESPVAGYVNLGGPPLALESLGHVSAEADWLESKLTSIGALRVDRISPESIPAGVSYKAYLQALLTAPGQGPDVVHYCGHSYYDEASGKGYLFFPGQQIETLELDVFSAWLTQTSFLFLSGCQSSQQGFVFQLARRQVPVVLGFRCPIYDDSALEFTKQFYTALFEGDCAYCFERAFLSARRAMKELDSTNRIWAAPMLIVQGSD